jgi:hypothetical protein
LPENSRASHPNAFIELEPEFELEIRCIVYNTKDVTMMDVEGTSDVFFKVHLGDIHDKKNRVYQTDTHFRNMDGNASFNYRLKIPYKNSPEARKDLHILCYDKDLIMSNDLIGSNTLDLSELINDAVLTKSPSGLMKKYYEDHLKDMSDWKDKITSWEDKYSFWIDLFEAEGESKKLGGSVRMRIEIVPKHDALENPLGEGRNEPNTDPFLPPPEGRIEFSMDPLKMLKQLISPEIRMKIKASLCGIICCVLTIYLLPGLISSVIGNMIA